LKGTAFRSSILQNKADFSKKRWTNENKTI
jgi:hypothetical protein